MTEYSRAKTGEYPRIFPNFQNCARCEKDLKDNKDNSRNLGRKNARIFVLGHYLFLVAHSFPRASLSEKCSLLGTDNVRGRISEHIFAPNGDYCLCTIHCTGITFHMHHIVTDKEPVLISICIQYMKCSLFILKDVICYCLHTKSVIMKFKSDIYI